MVVQADEKWVENTARVLGRQLSYTPTEARWMGVVRLLARDYGLPIARAAELAEAALRRPLDERTISLAASPDSPVTLLIDLARYYSRYTAALSAALHHGGPRRRGRPRPRRRARESDPVAAAEAHGVDVSLLRESLELAPADRLARLDANATFLRELRRAR
jgi:hypothetical protein